MHTKFQAIPNRYDHSNSDLISASSDFQYWTDFKQLSYTSSNWIKLEINLIECIHKTYINSIHLLKVISWTYPTQINPNLITKHLIHSIIYSKQHCIFIQFNQLICTQINVINKDIPWLAYDHPICKLQLMYLQTIK